MIFNICVCSVLIHFLQARLMHFGFDKDYDYRLDSADHAVGAKKNLRESFLSKKKEHEDETVKISVLDQLEASKTGQSQKYEEIQHIKIDENNPDLMQIMKIENDFKSMLSQKNVKYYYKRDMYWRTWRSVKYGNEERMVFYKYHDLGINGSLNCLLCEGGGFWDIVDKPQTCAIEILSMKKNEEFCAVYHYELNHHFNSCPHTLKYLDLTGVCDNPIVTRWIFEMTFSKDNERNLSNILNGGNTKFELLTLYRIRGNEIIFQIINASSHVVYSKIMTKDNTSYACRSDCGEINPYNFNIQREKSMIVNLLENYKQKRHDKMAKELINELKAPQVSTENPVSSATIDEDVRDKDILASNSSFESGYISDDEYSEHKFKNYLSSSIKPCRYFSYHNSTTVSLGKNMQLHHPGEDLEC